jgi:hypothetical protein
MSEPRKASRMVPGVGIEPTRSFWDLRILSRATRKRVTRAETAFDADLRRISFQREPTKLSKFRRDVSPTLASH